MDININLKTIQGIDRVGESVTEVIKRPARRVPVWQQEQRTLYREALSRNKGLNPVEQAAFNIRNNLEYNTPPTTFVPNYYPPRYVSALRGDYSYQANIGVRSTYRQPYSQTSYRVPNNLRRESYGIGRGEEAASLNRVNPANTSYIRDSVGNMSYSNSGNLKFGFSRRVRTPFNLFEPVGDTGRARDFMKGVFHKESSALFAGSVGLHFASSLLLSPAREYTRRDLDPAKQFQMETILAANSFGLGRGTINMEHLPHFKNAIKRMSLSYSQDPVEIMQSARQLAQAGFSGKDVLGLMPSALKFSELTGGKVDIMQATDIARMLARKFRINTNDEAMNKALSQVFRATQVTSLDITDIATALNSLSSSPIEFPSSQLTEYLTTVGMMRNMGQMPAQAAATTAGFMKSISRLGAVENQAEQRLNLMEFFREQGIQRRTVRPNYRMFAQMQYFGTEFTKQFSVTEENLSRYQNYGKKVGDLIPVPEIIEKVSGQLTYKRDVQGRVIKDAQGKPVPFSEYERSAVMTQLGFSNQFKNVVLGYQQMQEGRGVEWNESLGSWVEEGKLLARGYNDILREIINSSKALDVGFKNMTGTLIQTENRLSSSRVALNTTMGEALLPAKIQSTEVKLGMVNAMNELAMKYPTSTAAISGGIEGLSMGLTGAKAITDIAGGSLMALAMIKTLSTRSVTLEEVEAANAAGNTSMRLGDLTWNRSAVKFGRTALFGMGSIIKGYSTGYSAFAVGAMQGTNTRDNIIQSTGLGLFSGITAFGGMQAIMHGKKINMFGKAFSNKKVGGALLAASLIPDLMTGVSAAQSNKYVRNNMELRGQYKDEWMANLLSQGYFSLGSDGQETLSSIFGIPTAELNNMMDGKLVNPKYAETTSNYFNTLFSGSLEDNFATLIASNPEFAKIASIRGRKANDFKNITHGGYLTPSVVQMMKEHGGGDIRLGAKNFLRDAKITEITDKRTIKQWYKGLPEVEKNLVTGERISLLDLIAQNVVADATIGGSVVGGLGALVGGTVTIPVGGIGSVPVGVAGAIAGAVVGAGIGVGKGINQYANQKKYPKAIYGISGGQGHFVGNQDIDIAKVQYSAVNALNPKELSELNYQNQQLALAHNSVDALDAINKNLIEFMKALMGGGSGKNQVTVNQIFKSADRELLRQQAYQLSDIVVKNLDRMNQRSFNELKLVGDL